MFLFQHLIWVLLFVIAHKARATGEYVKRCRCVEGQKAKAGGWQILTHTRWKYLRGGKWRGVIQVQRDRCPDANLSRLVTSPLSVLCFY